MEIVGSIHGFRHFTDVGMHIIKLKVYGDVVYFQNIQNVFMI